MEKVFI